MNEPKRIQRRRTKGWRMPEGAVYVGRPSKWGNPYVAGRKAIVNGELEFVYNRARAVQLYRERGADWNEATRTALRGKDLVCWCPLDEPCHGDVLLEWANDC